MAEFHVDYTSYIFCDSKRLDKEVVLLDFHYNISNSSTKENSTLCYKDGPLLPPLNFTASCVKQGHYITFYNKRVGSVHYPVDYRINAVYTELCEVIVSGNNLYPSLKKKKEKI